MRHDKYAAENARLRAALNQAQDEHENATAQQLRDEAEATLEKTEELWRLSSENERLKAENEELKANKSRQRLEQTVIRKALASIEEQKLDLLAETEASHAAIVELEYTLAEFSRSQGKIGLCKACGWLSSGLCHCGSGHKYFRPQENLMAHKRGDAGRYARTAVQYAVGNYAP